MDYFNTMVAKFNSLTPLHWASCTGQVGLVRLILKEGGVDLNAETNDGETPLVMAAKFGFSDIFDLLIQYGAQVYCGIDYKGWTPLHWASYRGWVDQVVLILDGIGANLNAESEGGETPLSVAAKNGHREIFDFLIRYGARVNCGIDNEGLTPLHWATFRGWVDQVRLILEKGVDLNNAMDDGEELLTVAARHGHKEIFKLLIQYGATMDVNYAQISNRSFLKDFLTDVNLCTQIIANKFHCQSLPTLYRNPDFAKKLPLIENFQLSDEQTQHIAEFVESEIKTKKFCNVFNSQPIILKLMCVQSLLSHQSTRKMSPFSDSNLQGWAVTCLNETNYNYFS